MQRAVVVVFAVLLPLLSFAAEQRVALVIGNNAYRHVEKLGKAVNDARSIGEQLGKLGFKVSTQTDLDRAAMNKAINEFVRDVQRGGIGVFFFAGHGLQIRNQNFLVPIDFEVPSDEADIEDQAISVPRLQDKLADARAKFTLLVLDACRNNPLPAKSTRGLGLSRGLAQASSPDGQVIVYSAGANQEALDSLGPKDSHPNSVFTREFVSVIAKPNLSVTEALRQIRTAVKDKARSVGHDQLPALYDQSDGDFYFVINGPATINIQSMPASASVELVFWESVQKNGDPDDYQEYLRQFPLGQFAVLARNRLKAMQQATVSAVPVIQDKRANEIYELAKKGDAAKLAELRALASAGNIDAQAGLGRIYANGWGVAKEYPEARVWAGKAAEQGSAAGQNTLAHLLLNGFGVVKDEAEALKWYRKSAEQGYPNAQTALGSMHERGRGLVKDEAEAAKWYRKAAEQGYANAQSALGYLYERGKGVARDDAEAVRWYRKAAEQGFPGGQNGLGWMMANGRGIEKNEAEAINLYRKAIEQGHAPAQSNMGWMYENGWGVPKDEAEAVRWYRLAAEQGNAAGQNNLGRSYAAGRGLKKEEAEAVKWYRKAVAQGNSNAQTNLANMLRHGKGTDKDESEAVRLYRLAAEQGLTNAQYALGLLYRDGALGLPRDRAEALNWLTKAADNGHKDAQAAVAKL